jgi:hypothetical protein
LLSTNTKEFAMRKLTPEEKAAKKALAHTHDENCGHAEAPAVAPVAEEAPAKEGPTGPFTDALSPDKGFAEEAPKKKKKSEEATVAEEA